jgi:NAD+ synthetase
MKIALAQTAPVIGALDANVEALVSAWARAAAAGADVVVSPELSVTGYPPRDLLHRPEFLARTREAVHTLAARTRRGPPLVVGAPVAHESPGPRLQNVALVLQGGDVVHRQAKRLLPTYDVFDEARYFAPGATSTVWTFGGERIAFSVCEDLWNEPGFDRGCPYPEDPWPTWSSLAPSLHINLSASPWHVGKSAFREALLARVAVRAGTPVVYCNQSGAHDELIFDGQSLVVDAGGTVCLRGPAFEEALLMVDTRALAPQPGPGTLDEALLWKALVTGTRHYVERNGFSRVVLGLSGGIDSAVTACIAVDALGPDAVLGVAMPGPYSSTGSVTDALALAANLGIACPVVPIAAPLDGFAATLHDILGGPPEGLTEENLQARSRGVVLMALSNQTGRLLLTTGNKSEVAVGYCTLYGDMCGGLSVLSDVVKTRVWALARWRNAEAGRPLIPLATLTKPPSAELRPDQTDQDSLPPYEVLDGILEAYVEREMAPCDIAGLGFAAADIARVVQLIDRAEYKRRQAAPGLRVTPLAFGVGRRLPVAHGWRPPLPALSAAEPASATGSRPLRPEADPAE